MHDLTMNELKQVSGGGVSVGMCFLIGAGIVFLIGVIDGYVRPLGCN